MMDYYLNFFNDIDLLMNLQWIEEQLSNEKDAIEFIIEQKLIDNSQNLHEPVEIMGQPPFPICGLATNHLMIFTKHNLIFIKWSIIKEILLTLTLVFTPRELKDTGEILKQQSSNPMESQGAKLMYI